MEDNEINKALLELGMLSAVTNARQEYIREVEFRSKQKDILPSTCAATVSSTAHQSPCYIRTTRSNSWCMNTTYGKYRHKPYASRSKLRRERTISENDELSLRSPEFMFNVTPIVENVIKMAVDAVNTSKHLRIRRTQSVEDIKLLGVDNSDVTKPTVVPHELEFVSRSIQDMNFDD